jgi:hypothetical protein
LSHTYQGIIELDSKSTVSTVDLGTEIKNAFAVTTPTRTWLLSAETPQSKDEWIAAIKRALMKFSKPT